MNLMTTYTRKNGEMTDLIRCTDCQHNPGLGSRCAMRSTVHANRHLRTCEWFELARMQFCAAFNLPAPTCGHCAHRSPTSVCYAQTNARHQLVRVAVDDEACHLFRDRHVWGKAG